MENEIKKLKFMYAKLGVQATYDYCVLFDFGSENRSDCILHNTIWRCLRLGMTLKEAIAYFKIGDFDLPEEWQVFGTYYLCDSGNMVWVYAFRISNNQVHRIVLENGEEVFELTEEACLQRGKRIYKQRRIEKQHSFEKAKEFIYKNANHCDMKSANS